MHIYTREKFIYRAQEVHGKKYNYDKVTYVNNKTKVIITCSIHGDFTQTPTVHLSGSGCKKCVYDILRQKRTPPIKEVISKFKKIHGDKYNYNKVDYVTCMIKVTITCPIHGDFKQRPNDHLSGYGCKKCGNDSNIQKRTATPDVIAKFKEIHGDKYNYNKVDYVGSKRKVIITCPMHGDFTQTPTDHISGNACQKCNSSKGEIKIRKYLTDNNIFFEEQKRFPNELGKQRFDFYIPAYNILIEFQGKQHYEPINFGGISDEKSILEFNKRKELDQCKRDFCIKNNYSLIEIKYDMDVEKELSKLHEVPPSA
jgi:hypothetical protein